MLSTKILWNLETIALNIKWLWVSLANTKFPTKYWCCGVLIFLYYKFSMILKLKGHIRWRIWHFLKIYWAIPMIFRHVFEEIETNMRWDCIWKALHFLKIMMEHQDCPVLYFCISNHKNLLPKQVDCFFADARNSCLCRETYLN